jgi:Leucine-rich repeat (LRR) protein
MVSFKSNSLNRIDEEALTSSITWLILTDNELSSIPRSIGKLTHLRKCMMAGNKLTSLPEEMAGCQELELLRLAANDLTELPSWLLKLPKLSWLAFAGNPIGSATTTALGTIYRDGCVFYCIVCMYCMYVYADNLSDRFFI